MQTGEAQVLYRDRWIECTSEALVIHGYYFPFGNRRTIAYSDIRGVYEFELGLFTGKLRIWGSGDFKYFFNLDPGRPRKKRGLIVDIGGRVAPVITPDDTAQVEAIIESRLERPSPQEPPYSRETAPMGDTARRP